MPSPEGASVHERWALFRFAVVGPLLADPPDKGELAARLRALADTSWQHPISGEPLSVGFSSIERWLSLARGAPADPVGALRDKVRSTAGSTVLGDAVVQALGRQYAEHKSWSYKLHADNLRALAELGPELGAVPSDSTVRRYMKRTGWVRLSRQAEKRERKQNERGVGAREVRSYEVAFVHALWHLDFHQAKRRRVLYPDGHYGEAHLMAVLDDRSRLCCHAQWYPEETSEALVHGLSQAMLKRGLCQGLMTDNGAAELAAEVTEGLARLGITHERTLEYSPHQNGKQEKFWDQVEGRLMAMLEGKQPLTLAFLNDATQAWVEGEYNQARHDELGTSPAAVVLAARSVGRDAPTVERVRQAFTKQLVRTQRRSDGTLSIEGVRFELPSAYRHIRKIVVRVARWDLTVAWLVDPQSGAVLGPIYPLDKQRNAERPRAQLVETAPAVAPSGIAPLMEKLMRDYARTGLPPAYVPHPSQSEASNA
jgi:putative transposase